MEGDENVVGVRGRGTFDVNNANVTDDVERERKQLLTRRRRARMEFAPRKSVSIDCTRMNATTSTGIPACHPFQQ